MLPELRDVILIDIETVACAPNYDALDERLKVQWARKSSYLRRNGEETDADLFPARAGIYAEFGSLVCIGDGRFVGNEEGELMLRTPAYADHTAGRLLSAFTLMLQRTAPLTTSPEA